MRRAQTVFTDHLRRRKEGDVEGDIAIRDGKIVFQSVYYIPEKRNDT